MWGFHVGPPLCQALGFPIPTMIFHSRGSRSRELNPSGLSSCFWIPLLPLQPAQPCFRNTVSLFVKIFRYSEQKRGPSVGQQRLVFLENVHVPTPLSSSRDAERRAFPTLEKEPLLRVPVDLPKGPSTHFTCGGRDAHEASWPAPSHLSGARLTQVFQKVMLSLSCFMELGDGREQQTQSHLLRDLRTLSILVQTWQVRLRADCRVGWEDGEAGQPSRGLLA